MLNFAESSNIDNKFGNQKSRFGTLQYNGGARSVAAGSLANQLNNGNAISKAVSTWWTNEASGITGFNGNKDLHQRGSLHAGVCKSTFIILAFDTHTHPIF